MKLSLDSIGYGGYFTAPGESLPLGETFKKAAAFGYDAVCIYAHRPLGFPLDFDEHPLAIGWASSPHFLRTSSGDGEHTAEDVGVHAMGPGSEGLAGLNENTDINAVMRAHLGL